MLTTLLLSIVGQTVEPTDRWSFATDIPDDLTVVGRPEHVGDGAARALILDGQGDYLLAPRAARPVEQITASAWVAVNATTRWGGIVGVIQDNGDAETGWLLGYDDDTFTFAVSSTGANERDPNGDGVLTYMDGQTPLVKGRWHHVVGTYDGTTMRLYVDGRLDAESTAQSGPILYPEQASYAIGAYVDANELYPMHGRLLDVSVHDTALDARTVRGLFEQRASLTSLPPVFDTRLRMTVEPYLQRVGRTGITVMWETSRPTRGVIHYGKEVPLVDAVDVPEGTLHEIRLDGLDPEQQYFYQVACHDDLDQTLESPVRTFQTAVEPGTPYAFAVIGDTQASPKVVRAIAEHAWSMRPSFAVHAGDLVSTGSSKTDWTRHYFPNMSPLISRVPIFPVLGNHEGDADWYYEYTSAPDPEHRYAFTYGNARFFMVDSNRPTGAGTEQHAWLEAELAAATEPWKFVVHHHPVYTSDSDDYGDTYKGASNQGDPRVRPLVPLYERYGVDIVFNGHVHFYERTWPIRDGRVVEDGGVIYVTAAGGGGSLERFAPTRTWFGNTIMRGHHYCLIAINGGTLQFKAYDLEGRLFDAMTLKKEPRSAPKP